MDDIQFAIWQSKTEHFYLHFFHLRISPPTAVMLQGLQGRHRAFRCTSETQKPAHKGGLK